MVQHRLRRVAAAAACVTAMAGGGVVMIVGAPAALAGTVTTTYSCSLTGVAPEAQAGALTLTAPGSGTPSSSVQVNFSQPSGGSTAPVPISSITISGTGSVSGDGATTTLPFTGSVGAITAGSVIPPVTANASLTLPASSGTVTVTLPTSYILSLFLTGLGAEAGTCTATSPGSQSITVASQPTVTIGSISGQSGTSTARAGATVNFSGTGFAPGATVSVSLVPASGGSAIPLTTSPGTITATGGAITGSATLPSSVTGAYGLTFSDTSGDLPQAVPLTVLGAPSCTASPASGGAGTVTTVSCTSFDPHAAVSVQSVNSSGTATSDPAVAATADSNGAVTASYTVNATTTAGIAVTETTPESLSAVAPFSASANGCIADQNGATGGSCSISQGATFTVSPGALEMQQTSSQIKLSNITLNGTPQTVTGSLNQITVADLRGSALGWTLNATATNFTGSNSGSIPASSLTVTPGCVPDPAGLAAAGASSFPSKVTAGPAAAMGSAVTLCSTPALGSGTGGVFDVTGALSLALPAYLRTGTYLNTITFSLG